MLAFILFCMKICHTFADKQQIRHRIKRNNRQIDTNNIGFTVNHTIINKKIICE